MCKTPGILLYSKFSTEFLWVARSALQPFIFVFEYEICRILLEYNIRFIFNLYGKRNTKSFVVYIYNRLPCTALLLSFGN